mgnify:CR=1 FL=1
MHDLENFKSLCFILPDNQISQAGSEGIKQGVEKAIEFGGYHGIIGIIANHFRPDEEGNQGVVRGVNQHPGQLVKEHGANAAENGVCFRFRKGCFRSNVGIQPLCQPGNAKIPQIGNQYLNAQIDGVIPGQYQKNAAKNAEYIGYATPNQAAKALLPKSITDDKAFYPSESTIKNLEVYNNLGQKWLGIYNDIYLQVKMYRK